MNRSTCARCGCHLRAGNAETLCDPCAKLVESCAPFVAKPPEPAPANVNLVELVAGIMLTHDALHPSQPLYLREALAGYGIDADHVKIQQVVKKLNRRHRLILEGEPLKPGYVLRAWLWTARRTRSSVESVCSPSVAVAVDNEQQTIVI